jgi:copper chaperone
VRLPKAAGHQTNSQQKELSMTTVTYSIPAIHCMHCTHTIEQELAELDGVKSVKGDAAQKQVTVAFDAPATEDGIKFLLAEIEYPVAAQDTAAGQGLNPGRDNALPTLKD